MTHLKRLNMPVSWPMSRKEKSFAVSPVPGPHARAECIPLQVMLREMLGYAENAREARSILSQGKLLVDRKPRKEPRFPVGLMDVIEIPDARQHFRMASGGKGLELERIGQDEAAWKTCKIIGKKTLKGGIQQINLHDGRNLLLKKDTYRVGDSLKISLPEQKILKHYRFEIGARGFVTAGRNRGAWGRIKEIEEKKHSLEKSTVTLDTGKREIKTLREYIFVAEQARKPAERHEKKETPERKSEAKKPGRKK